MDVAPSVPLLRQEQRDCERRSVQRIKSILKKIGSKNGVRLMFLSVYVFDSRFRPAMPTSLPIPPKKPSSPMRNGAFPVSSQARLHADGQGKDYSCESPHSRSNRIVLPVRRSSEIGRKGHRRGLVPSACLSVCRTTPRRRHTLRRQIATAFGPSPAKSSMGKESAPGFALFAFILLFLGLLLAEWVGRIRKRNERRLD